MISKYPWQNATPIFYVKTCRNATGILTCKGGANLPHALQNVYFSVRDCSQKPNGLFIVVNDLVVSVHNTVIVSAMRFIVGSFVAGLCILCSTLSLLIDLAEYVI